MFCSFSLSISVYQRVCAYVARVVWYLLRRNPWRGSFDKADGKTLMVADVGQDMYGKAHRVEGTSCVLCVLIRCVRSCSFYRVMVSCYST